MSDDIDGVYSVIASGTAGSSLGVIEIRDRKISGNDNAGSRYGGFASRNHDGSVSLNITMETPPGIFHIWSGAIGETFQKRALDLTVPQQTFDNARPYEMPEYGMTVIFRRVPVDYAVFAGPDGLRAQIAILEEAERTWQRHSK